MSAEHLADCIGVASVFLGKTSQMHGIHPMEIAYLVPPYTYLFGISAFSWLYLPYSSGNIGAGVRWSTGASVLPDLFWCFKTGQKCLSLEASQVQLVWVKFHWCAKGMELAPGFKCGAWSYCTCIPVLNSTDQTKGRYAVGQRDTQFNWLYICWTYQLL